MSLRATIICLFLFVALCFSDLNINLQGELHQGYSFNFTIPASNLYDFALFSINNSAPVVVCLQERFPIPPATQFANYTCTHFFNFSETSNARYLPLRNLEYNVGVYYAHTPTTNTTVSLTIAGSTCQPNFYYDQIKKICVMGNSVNVGTPYNIIVEEYPSTNFYFLEAPGLLGSVSLDLKEVNNHPATLRLRFAGVPSAEIFDADNLGGSLVFDSPRPGLWVVAFEAQMSGEFTLTVNVEDCSSVPGMAGPGCKTPYTMAEDNVTLTAFPGVYQYWKYVASADAGLNVSVTTLKGEDIPYLLVSQGNLPTLGNADITNCNQGYCNVVSSIHVTPAQGVMDQIWFIAVTASVHEGNTTYGIWFNSTCAPECETDNHGTCQEDGTCTCQLDFTGIDCTVSKGLGAQYIVLIIIASLVVASAIIGFVAWAYMRRKRVNYELVS